jgi:hypothetical protein
VSVPKPTVMAFPEPISLEPISLEPISPELALVSPELRERACRGLPTIDPDELFVVVPRARPSLALAPAPASPAGSLPLAVGAYVAEAVVLGALRGAAMVGLIAVAAFLLSW